MHNKENTYLPNCSELEKTDQIWLIHSFQLNTNSNCLKANTSKLGSFTTTIAAQALVSLFLTNEISVPAIYINGVTWSVEDSSSSSSELVIPRAKRPISHGSVSSKQQSFFSLTCSLKITISHQTKKHPHWQLSLQSNSKACATVNILKTITYFPKSFTRSEAS